MTDKLHRRSSSIQVLEGLEPVRRRPGMYVGDTGSWGITHLLLNLLDAVQGCEGWGTSDAVELDVLGPSAWVVATTAAPPRLERLHRDLTELVSGGCACPIRECARPDTLGLAVLNALCVELDVDFWFAGENHRLRASRGKIVEPIRQVLPPAPNPLCSEAGMRFHCVGDPQIFQPETALQLERIAERMELLACFGRGPAYRLRSSETERAWSAPDGLAAWVRARSAAPVLREPVVAKLEVGRCHIELAFNWDRRAARTVRSYANGAHTLRGGPHESALLECAGRAAHEPPGELIGIISVSGPPTWVQFEGCTRDRLLADWLSAIVRRRLADEVRRVLDSSAHARDVLRLAYPG